MNQEPVRVSSFQEVYDKCQKAGKPALYQCGKGWQRLVPNGF